MSFLDKFKGRLQRTPKHGLLDILGTRTNQTSISQENWNESARIYRKDEKLNKIYIAEQKLKKELNEINDIYQLRKSSKALTEQDTYLNYRRNDSAMRSAKNILKY